MKALQINQTIDLLALVGGDLRKAGNYHIGACPFCGGDDRFTIKHTEDGDRWHCRQCGDGKYHTAIDFVMRRDDCDFKTAFDTLSGDTFQPPATNLEHKKIPKSIALPSSDWQASAWRYVDEAANCLVGTEAGCMGREYLSQRGFHRGTWHAWHLGFTFAFDPVARRARPAVVIPWVDMDAEKELIFAVKYRFIDEDRKGVRYSSVKGSTPVLFGLWDVLQSDQTLLLIEGEFNALAVWQCRPRGVSVLSFGSETGGRADILRAAAKPYRRVFIWCDEAERTKKYQDMLSRPCVKLQSPERQGLKADANTLLQMGELSGVVSRILGVECIRETGHGGRNLLTNDNQISC